MTAPSSTDATDLLGGRYALGSVLGRGGMADVHRANDTVLGRDVAVKVFRPHVEDVDRTSSEVRLLASLNHPGLVSLYDAGTTDDGAPWLVMELVEGPTLSECCLDGSLSHEQVAAVGADLAEALAHCHERGVVHRDVKPANVLLTAGRRAKLTDFGIALIVDAARHTATGMTVGTAPYFSPEQVRGGVVGPPTDVYSLGLVLLECLTGHREYAERDAVACAVARLHRSPVVPTGLPAPWPDLLAGMTASSPAHRPTAAQVATALRLASRTSPQVAETVASDGATTVLDVSEPVAASVPVDATRVLDAPPVSPVSRAGAVAAPVRVDPAGPRRWSGRGLPWDRRVLAGLMGLLLLGSLVGVVAAASSSDDLPPARTPLERLERSVQP